MTIYRGKLPHLHSDARVITCYGVSVNADAGHNHSLKRLRPYSKLHYGAIDAQFSCLHPLVRPFVVDINLHTSKVLHRDVNCM